ncbi:Phosphopantetheine adenylyltransferase [hydrothermal vent metagenome]|uniref:Phosphopantetheine adenylyltransferase n=1 Tax=hydrothermal vent metagenome TaxID=652676 RepID=A0A1W1C6J3_9ZZZZ
MNNYALYPGTFDPITNGHLDIIRRACKIFDKVYVAVAASNEKKPMFSLKEREEMARLACKELEKVEIVSFDTLTVDLAKKLNATVLIRGLRAVSDFEYELQLGYLNRSLDNEIETIYLMPRLDNAFVSSSSVRALLKFNGKVEHLVPKEVWKYIDKQK